MNKNELQEIFQKEYSRENWIKVFSDVFPKFDQLAITADFEANNENFQYVKQLGTITLKDDKQIRVFEIKVSDTVNLSRSRVKLNNLLSDFIDQWETHAAIGVFFKSTSTVSVENVENNRDGCSTLYRFTFAQKANIWGKEGMEEIKTHSKRYTYVLGPNESAKTASERFAQLAERKSITKMDDVIEAFSVEALNKEFYKKIQKVFYQLTGGEVQGEDFECGCLKLPTDRDKDRKSFQEFAVRLLGRTVFCWFLKKKISKNNIPLISDNILSSKIVASSADYYHEILEKLFFQTLNTPIDKRNDKYLSDDYKNIPFLNGGLFEPKAKDFYEAGFEGISKYIGTVKIPNEWFENFFSMLEEYNFTIDENLINDAEVSVDPEILGRIFENLLAEINPETGKTARNATGSFYTPREIVEYMVEESLKQYLNSKLNISLSLNEIINNKNLHKKIIKALSEIKIIDPACGSGAFPVGILQKIVSILQIIDPNKDQWLDAQLDKIKDLNLPTKEEDKRLNDLIHAFDTNEADYGRKLGIIQNSVYGIDIQTIAVEISKLRFFLSLIVDETIYDDEPNRGIEPLPNLEFKFVAANTLISAPEEPPDNITGSLPGFDSNDLGLVFDDDEFFTHFSQYTKDYFYAKSPHAKTIIKGQIEILIRQKVAEKSASVKNLITAQQEHIREALEEKYKKELSKLYREMDLWESYQNIFKNQKVDFFDIKYFFPDAEDGFDIVIGNPPYVQIQKFSGQQCQKDWQNENYATFARTGDIYSLFYERGWQLLKDDGHLCFITSNKWMRANYGKATRKFFAEKTNPVQIIDFGGYKVFESATVDTNILIFQKKSSSTVSVENKENNNRDGCSTLACSINKDFSAKTAIKDYVAENAITLDNLSEESWIISSKEEYEIKNRIEEIGTPLKDWDISINYGIKTGFNEAFIISEDKKNELIDADAKNVEIIKPILRGRDIKKYSANFANLWLINTHNGVRSENIPRIDVENKYPIIYEHLKQYEEKLTKRSDKGEHWSNLRNCAYLEEFEKEKIAFPVVNRKWSFPYIEKDVIILAPMRFITAKQSLMFIRAVFGSRLIQKWWKTAGNMQDETGYQMDNYVVEKVPIPKISLEQQQPFEILVDMILFAKSAGLESESQRIESVIDLMVFALYFKEEMREQECYITDYLNVSQASRLINNNDNRDGCSTLEKIKSFYKFTEENTDIQRCLNTAHHKVKPIKIIYGDK